MDLNESTRQSSESVDIADILQCVLNNGLPEDYNKPLTNPMWGFSCTSNFQLSVTSSNVDSPQINLTPDSEPVSVQLRDYTASQREFMKKTIDELVSYVIMYPNCSSLWASALYIVLKPGPAMWLFNTDLSPVNKLTVLYQILMSIIEHKLTKNSKLLLVLQH